VPRLPLYSGSRLPLVALPEDAVLLAAPPPLEPLADVGAAVVEALRYPLAGAPLAELAPRGGRATIVVEPPSLPLPTAQDDPRRDALAAALEELRRHGVAPDQTTLLVAGGLARRVGRRELEALLRPDRARAFRGRVAVHDCEADDLGTVDVGGRRVRIHRAVLDTDLVLAIGAGETVLHGGASALLGACAPGTIRGAGAVSLLEVTGASGWQLAAALEDELARAVPVVGLSLVLDHPRGTGIYRGYPWRREALDGMRRSPLRRLLNAAPAPIRRRVLAGAARELAAVAVFAGPPSVAHAEALVRGTAVRSVPIERPFETIVVPLPWEGPHLPREPLNPITAAALGLGHVLRLWRDRPPLVEGGTVVLLHPFSRVMGHGPQAPYLALFAALRDGATARELGRAEAQAARDRRAIAAYRGGGAPHPRLPFADWETCTTMLERAGSVIVAGCRDAGAARALGLVPSHNAATALQMAEGLGGPSARTGVILGPPYPPLVVGTPG
jgi:hypothetical protein